jgi:2-methylisocitrate lyase-like PEP mutase family enzyme
MTSKSTALKELYNRPGACAELVFPINAFHAKILEDLGFEGLILGAAAVLSPILGRVDNGTISLTESVMVSKWFADAVRIPCITDTDACFGGIFQVQLAVKEFIQAGIAGIVMEDQPFLTKRMGAVAGKEVVPIEDAVAKLRVAIDVRDEICPDFQITARCDALTAVNANGLAETIKRLLAYKAAGADVLHFEGPRTLDEVREVRAAVPGPLVCTAYSLPEEITAEEGVQLGLAAVYYLQALRSNVRFMYYLYNGIREKGFDRAIEEFNASCPVDDKVLGKIRRKYTLGDLEAFERKYLGEGVAARYDADAGRSLPKTL